jgi:LCP family protein required for cell wall assembly
MIKNTLIAICGIVCAAVVFAGYKALNFYNAIYKPTQEHQINKKVPSRPKTAYNILLLGYGGPGHDGAYLTDTMMVAHVDMEKKKATMISIPRDIWVNLETKSGTPFHAKVNTVYQIEKFPNTFPDVQADNLTRTVVEQITGLVIDNIVTIDFNGFKKAIDILGGIDVTVQRAFTDKEYPIEGKEDDLCGKEEKDLPELEKIATESSPWEAFPCRYETLNFSAGAQTMDGARALKFVRSRHGNIDGGDFGRAARQQRFIEGLREKLLSFNVLTSLTPLLDELKDNITIDIDQETMKKFIAEMPKINEYRIENLVMSDNDYLDFGNSDDGQSILEPKAGEDNWKDVHVWIKNAIAGITPSPTKAITVP